jgi:hypothetical protein
VTETIKILTADEACDAMAGTYNFLQVREGRQNSRRKTAALIHSASVKHHDKMMALLATCVQLSMCLRVYVSMCLRVSMCVYVCLRVYVSM